MTSPRAEPGGLLARAFAQALLRLERRLGEGDRAGQGHEPPGCGHTGPAGRDPEAPASREATLATWAERVWKAAADGHACVAVDEAGARERLASCRVVAVDGRAALPLVLDGAALYLQRLWQAESGLAASLVALDAAAPLATADTIDALLAEVAAPEAVDERQRAAIRTALMRRLAVVTGGPGTGKTTTLARLLVAFSRLAPDARVAIAAPTGKAAARLAQALGEQLGRIDASGALSARLPSAGLTVHRLLGLRGSASRLAQALRYDLVIVDEASMLDLEMAAALAASIPDGGRLVLAGDRDQLASVEAGAVFAEACASPLEGVVRLQRNYRQASAPALTALSGWLRDRHRAPQALPAPFAPAAGVELRTPRGASAIADQALAAWEPALARVASGDHAGPAQAVSIVAAFERHRVLCAMREGPLGVEALNAAIAARVRERVGAPPGALWYPGRIVIVVRNRPELELANGDVGICLPLPAAASDAATAPLAVVFDTGGGALRWLPVRQMPAHDDAFAMTVHKAQGSEFDSVALVAAPRGHRLNTRELLYTGATRARSRLVVWAEPTAIEDGAMRRTERHGRLADRIARLRES